MGFRKDRVLVLVGRFGLGRRTWVLRRVFWRGQGSSGVDTVSIHITVRVFFFFF